MRIDNDGNVGIGSSDPSTRLHITPPDNTTANKIDSAFLLLQEQMQMMLLQVVT